MPPMILFEAYWLGYVAYDSVVCLIGWEKLPIYDSMFSLLPGKVAYTILS